MKMRYWLWLGVALVGAIAGALGTRILISAPDISVMSDFPIWSLLIFPAFGLLFARMIIAFHGKRARFAFHVFLGLGIYGAFYGLFELLFHPFNHRMILSSASLLLFGLDICLSCYLSLRVFGHLILTGEPGVAPPVDK